MSLPPISIHRLKPADLTLLRRLNALFGQAFEDPDAYGRQPPDDSYLADMLAKQHIVVLVAAAGEQVLGGLVAYELDKLERARRELYIYDLAVAAQYRRQGIATALIEHLRDIASRRSAWVIYVQADHGDAPAISLYEKFAAPAEVLHFDIAIAPPHSQ